LENSETKYIGTHGGNGIPNPIDLDALKKSSVPFDPKLRSSDDFTRENEVK